jgi:CubicO group peptidase (beta-lactamase class C family)
MRPVIVLALLSLLPCGGLHAQLLPEADRTRIDAVFAAFASREGPGCALGIGRNGQLVYGAGYGMADLEHDIPITSSTPFYIASTSKQFAAFAIVLLARDGRLSFDDDVRRYVPELHDFGTPTIPAAFATTSKSWEAAGGLLMDS